MANEFKIKNGLVSDGNIVVTGSITATGGINISGSIASAETASFAPSYTLSSSFNSYTSSASSSVGSLSSSVATTTSGLASRIGSVETKTGSYATTGSNIFIGDQTITGSICSNGNIVTTGQIVAQTINVQQVTSSIVFSSGSNIFGNNSGNTHRFTGSLQVSGSSHYVLGNVGIGTDSPGQILTLSSANTLGTALNIINTSSGGYNWNIFSGGSDASLGPIGSLIFRDSTNGATRLIITSGGNVGIGTTSPTFALDVASTSADTLRLNRIGVGGTGSASSMSFQVTQTNSQSATLASISAEFISNWGGDLRLYTKPANGTPNDSVTERMRITSAGFVGLGCTSPSYALDINDTNGSGVRGMRISTSSSSVGPSIVLRYSPGGLINWLVGTSQLVSHSLEFIASCALSGDPGVNGTTRMILTCGGQVGIGTTTTSAEANLFLGAQGSTEGGQMVFQKATSFQCATHIDNYSNCFRIMSGTDTGSSTVNMSINHINGNATFVSSLTANTITGTNGVNTVSTVSSIPFTTWTTLATIDSNTTGMYLVVIGLTGGGGALTDWTATGILYTNGSTAAWITGPTNGSLVQLRISGLAIQVYQNGTNPNISLSYKLLKIQ